MSEPYLAEIRIVSFNFAPQGWAFCNGQLMPINLNQALFSILGTTYGGDGRTTFALPNLQGRTPIHEGGGHVLGETGGETSHTVIINELPSHSHPLKCSAKTADQRSPVGLTRTLGGEAKGATLPYAGGATNLAPMNPAMLVSAGGNQPHNNMMPQRCANHHDLHPCSESWRPGRQEPGGQLVRKDAMRVMRKPYKTLEQRKNEYNLLKKQALGSIARGALSGSKTRRRVYLETI